MTVVRMLETWRACVRLLRTEKERVGTVERVVRALLLVVPYKMVERLLRFRLASHGPLTVEGMTDDGIRMPCRLPDVIGMYVYLFGSWEPDLAAFMRRRLEPGDTFVDVGANVGCISALAAKLVGSRGTVVAIEPSPPVVAILRETLERNDLTNVRLVSSAVSDRDHDLPLFAGPGHNIGLTSTVAHDGLREFGRAKAAPLGSLVTGEELSAARLIKIDVEGAEDRVLAGMTDSIDALAANAELVVELSPTWWIDPRSRPIDVLRPFLDRGFHVYVLPNDYSPWRYLWPMDVGAPQRLRNMAVLDRRAKQLDIVLSRIDADEL
jgi:FkbM family methyltransferase